MKSVLAAITLFLLSPLTFAQQNIRVEAHCETVRIDTQDESMVSDKSEEKLSFSTPSPGTTRGYTYLESPLIPSYMIEFVVVGGGDTERMLVRTLRKYDQKVMSSFRSAGLVTNTQRLTANSAYTAEAKNIFVAGAGRYIFDISCWQNVIND